MMLDTLKEKTGLEVEENIPLKNLTTIHVGGSARYFIKAFDVHELLAAAKAVTELGLKFFVLGAGSNLVISEAGFDGVVIKNESGDMSIEGKEVMVDSGISLGVLIRKLAELDMGGLEFMMGIPGTLGGAVVNNAGAFGDHIGNHIKSVTMLDRNGEVRIILKGELKFGYRTSIFKQTTNHEKRGVILRVRLILRKGAREEISRKINNYLRLRDDQPKGFSSGSFFKNPRIDLLEKEPVSADSRRAEPRSKNGWEQVVKDGRIPAGYLLEQIGAKDMREGGIFVSPRHANWLINKGKGSAEEVKKLADSLKDEVDRKFGIELEEEVEYIGFEN